MRGDNNRERREAVTRLGAPPRARGQPSRASSANALRRSTPACAGTRGPEGAPDGPRRSTPACAGTTMGAFWRPWAGSEHPRVRGDNDGATWTECTTAGAPPRARGQRRARRRDPSRSPEHPRVRGDNRNTAAFGPRTSEHPRVRGDNVGDRLRHPLVLRSTPACAGTTSIGRSSRLRGRSTPACAGTTSSLTRFGRRPTGAPPRARGQRRGRLRGGRGRRSTPACAGTTTQRARSRSALDGRSTPACAGTTPRPRSRGGHPPEHPRVRGDNENVYASARAQGGAPPRARGQLGALACVARAIRSTPACAGTTRSRRATRRDSPEHPRVRGDNCDTCHVRYSRCCLSHYPTAHLSRSLVKPPPGFLAVRKRLRAADPIAQRETPERSAARASTPASSRFWRPTTRLPASPSARARW